MGTFTIIIPSLRRVAAIVLTGTGAYGLALLQGAGNLSAMLCGALAATILAFFLENRDRRAEMQKVASGIVTLVPRIEQLNARLSEVEDRLGDVEKSTHPASEAQGLAETAAEIEVLGTLVKEIAETLAQHDMELAAATRPVRDPAPTIPASPKSEPHSDNATMRAIEEGRVEVYLQPIVTLPQRRVKYYEALARIRTSEGQILTPDAFLGEIDTPERAKAFDRAVLTRLAQIMRRLLARNRDLAIFWNVSPLSLESEAGRAGLISLLQAHQEIANHLVVEMTQGFSRKLGGAVFSALAPAVALGFRFSMDGIADLRLDPRTLFDHGFRHVKVPASTLLADAARAPAEIHPQDLTRLLARNGLQLIATGLETERAVLDILDLDVRYAQGFVFSQPRPVRAELMQEQSRQEQSRQEADQPETGAVPAEASSQMPGSSAQQRLPYRSVLRRASG
jgi:cyclic-di-GMP phosphodiesterase, flagellum assembly factor TipF